MGCLARSRDRWVLVISSLRTCSLPEFLLTQLAAQPALAVRLLFSRVTGDSNSLPRAFPLPLTLRTLFWWCRVEGPCALGLGQLPSCVQPAVFLRLDPPRSARASQMRISLGFQTR